MKIKLISLCLLLISTLCQAENIIIPVGSQANQQQPITLPDKGMDKDSVKARFGEALEKTAASGEPPISRWIYADFSVYFENETVIHSVITHRPNSAADLEQP